MTCLNRKPVVVAITLAVLLVGSSARAQSASEPLVSAASLQGIQQQLNALRTQITALQASDSDLEGEVDTLQARNTALLNQVKNLQTSNAALESQAGTLRSQLAIVRVNPVLALGPFLRVDPNPEVGVAGPNVIFHGVNVHIVSGSGTTNDNGVSRGLGNLIIGYDEDPAHDIAQPDSLVPGDRGGSHNLIIGRYHRFRMAASGGLVVGEHNRVSARGASVAGGYGNTASGEEASVAGGDGNTASAFTSSVTGGQQNTANGPEASVTGGYLNKSSYYGATVTGGQQNTANGLNSSVIGGDGNAASGSSTVVLGGQNVTTVNANFIAPQPPFPNAP